jgi:hypothetical protein
MSSVSAQRIESSRYHPGPQASASISKDGRFLIPTQAEEAAAGVPMTVVVNWTAGLKK